jgi:hypothetical protein
MAQPKASGLHGHLDGLLKTFSGQSSLTSYAPYGPPETLGEYLADLEMAITGFVPSGSTLGLAPTGATSETISRELTTEATYALASGTLNLTAIQLTRNTLVSDISWFFGSTGDATPTHWWYVLCDKSLNVLAESADQLTTAITANAIATLAVATVNSTPLTPTTGTSLAATSLYTPYGGLYYLGVVVVTGTPTLVASANPTVTVNTVPPILNGTSNTGLTTPIVIPGVANTITPVAAIPYGYTS